MSIPIESFQDVVRSLDSLPHEKLTELVNLIRNSIKSYEPDFEKFRWSLNTLADTIMKFKDIKDEYVFHFEELINMIIKISIEKEFRVGSEAIRAFFYVGNEFYKTANLDPLLNYPIGRDRPLEQYNPAVGEECDVVKPYITSTSFCGWTRCKVLEIEKNKYTVKYANTDGPNMTRDKPWFAPLNSRMKDYNWRMGLDIGEPIDAYLNRVWYKSTITEVVTENEVKKVRVTFRRFDENGDRVDSFGNRFFGLKSGEDDWIDVLSPRIQQNGKMSDIPLCYYTFECEEILFDDFYDTLFEEEFSKKQFYSIMRLINTKSLSLMSFINTFVLNGGIEKVIEMMDNTEIKDDSIFLMIGNIGLVASYFPRMFVKQPVLTALYNKIVPFIERNVKNLNTQRIDAINYGFDNIGRRLFSLSKIHEDQNELRKMLVKEFLKMNLEKQMFSLRYLNELIFPKKPYTDDERNKLNTFIKDSDLFGQIFNQNTHEQIISRCGSFLQYIIEKEIVTLREFETLWSIVPTSDTRGRAVIEKLLTESCKKLPISFVQFLLEKILQLKETELTLDNLNLLKEIKNREIGNEGQEKILKFLWETLTVKSINIKTNIEEEVEKVFKSFISTLNDPKVRMNVLESMSQKLQECKKVKNEIELLKDFIKSYPEKVDDNQTKDQNFEGIPLNIFEAVNFLKSKNTYDGLLNLIAKSKEEPIRKDILQFLGFLFEYDHSDINRIISEVYDRLGPNESFFDWVYKMLPRSTKFATELFEKTCDFSKFTEISLQSFESIEGMVIGINELENNIKIIKTHHYKNNSSDLVPVTGDAGKVSSKEASYPNANTAEKTAFIGPAPPPEVKKHYYVLISPFKLLGMKFLEHLLQVVKSTNVFNANVKLIIRLISNLDESIESKTEIYRREFLEDIIKEIKSIVQENKCDDKIKAKLEVYCKLITEIFAETEVQGIGNLVPHFSTIEGEYITLIAENSMSKEKDKISIICNENFTVWRLKMIIGEILNMKPDEIDVIKYTDPLPDTNNCKSLNELLFYDKESIKIAKKSAKPTARASLLNEDKTEVSSKLKKIIMNWFNQYKNTTTNLIGFEELKRISQEQWKGSDFKKEEFLNKILADFDKDKKGALSEADFLEMFLQKSIHTPNTLWRLLLLAGYLNNLKPSKHLKVAEEEPEEKEENVVNVSALPRKILSSPEVYDLIYSIFNNPTFQELHQIFYKLLSTLETDSKIYNQIETKIYELFQNETSIYNIGYALEIANANLTARSDFYYNLWANSGLQIFTNKLASICESSSIYLLHPFMKDSVLPSIMKIINMYVSELLGQEHLVRFIYNNKVNCLDLEDFIKKVKESEGKEIGNLNKNKEIIDKLTSLRSPHSILAEVYSCSVQIFTNLIKNYEDKKTDFLQKLTAETVRSLASFTTKSDWQNINILDLVSEISNGLLNNRRSIAIIIFINLFHCGPINGEAIENILKVLIDKMPSESKIENYNYFSLLHEIVKKYLQFNEQTRHKDQYFIDLGNTLLDKLLNLPGEPRVAMFSDKVTLGILTTLEVIVLNKSFCQALSSRKIEITEKCLFAYNIEEKIQSLEITKEMLETQKQSLHFSNYVLCKSEDTRNLAYSIVTKMHEVNPDPDFIEKYIFPIVQGIKSDVRIIGQKFLDVGLKNFGSTCYMNSMLEVLNSVGPFRNGLMKCSSEAPLVKEMKKLFASLYFSERIDYAPVNLLNAFVPPINPGVQQDTTEFLNLLFDQLESGISDTNQKKIFDEIFKGANTVQMICHACGFKKERKEEFFSFGVEIDGKFDLQSAMEGTYQGEIITDYFCDECKNRGETTKRNILSDIPSIFFVHLRRIVFNYDIFANMKIHTRLQFPEEFSIEPYTKEGVELREQLGLEYLKNLSHSEEELKKFEELTLHGKEKDFYKLKLKGVIVHSGSADVGHYYSILNQDKTWRKYDDSRISIFTNSGFENECYGGSWTSEEWGSGSSANAYVLVYEKVVKNPIKIEEMGTNGEPQELEIVYDGIQVYNSPEDYREIWLDNHNFMVESHLLHEKTGKGFVDFVCKLIEISPPQSGKIRLISEIIYKISYHSGFVSDLQNQLILNRESTTPDILYFYILQDKQKTLKLLLNNDRNLREFMAHFINIVLLESFKKGDDKVKLDVLSYIIELLNAMAGEVAKNWLRVDGYFKMLFLLISHSVNIQEIWRLFMERNLISTLIDFVMEKQSPVRINPKNYSLGTKSNPMDFTFGIRIIRFLIGFSYGFSGRNLEVPSIPNDLLYHLNDNDVICLSFMEFYEKMLRERQSLRELGEIIQRLCVFNLRFSRAIIELTLEAIGGITDSKDEMSDLSSICFSILNIRDEYWKERAEMLLGVGLPYVLNNNLMATFDDERFTFTSTIFDIFPVECLFSYVYLYRLKELSSEFRNSLACFQLIRAIVQGCSYGDEPMAYLIKQPSPSYLFQDFIECIESFVNNFIHTLKLEPKHKERLEEEIKEVQKCFENLRNSGGLDKNQYKSLITGEISNKREIVNIEKDGILIKLNEYDVECVESNPNNGPNLPFGEYLHGYSAKAEYSADSDIWKFMRKPTKAIQMGTGNVEEEEKKELYGLFDEDPYPSLKENGPAKEESQEKSSLAVPSEEIILKTENMKDTSPEEQVPEPILPKANLPTHFKAPYFRQIEIINTTKEKKVVTLEFLSEENPNCLIPLNFGWKVSTKINESLWLAKQDVAKDWGQINLKCHVEAFDKDIHERKNIKKWWFKLYGNENPVVEVAEITQEPNENLANNESKDNNVEFIEGDEINCPICTAFNPATNEICEVCESPMK